MVEVESHNNFRNHGIKPPFRSRFDVPLMNAFLFTMNLVASKLDGLAISVALVPASFDTFGSGGARETGSLLSLDLVSPALTPPTTTSRSPQRLGTTCSTAATFAGHGYVAE